MASADFAPLRQRHQAALARLIAAAERVPAAHWNTPLRDGAWSPAQVTEHIRLAYQVLGGEFGGRQGIRIRTNWLQRTIARLLFLGDILEKGKIPRGARAPREVAPGPGPFDRDATLAAVRTLGTEFDTTLEGQWDVPGAHATHHIFGQLRPVQLLKFAATHAEHHAKQLAT